MKRLSSTFLQLTLLASLFGALFFPTAILRAEESFGRMTVEEVAKKITQKDFYVFDANGEETFLKSHLPGAKHVNFRAYKESDLPPNKEVTLLFYCKNEFWMASHEAARRAVKFGYKKSFVMPAGIDGWEKAKKPVEKGRSS